MPKYSYRCEQCTEEVEHYHSMNDVLVDCPICEAANSMVRLPSRFSLFKDNKESKVGDLVRASIMENQEELQQEKERLRKVFYEPSK